MIGRVDSVLTRLGPWVDVRHDRIALRRVKIKRLVHYTVNILRKHQNIQLAQSALKLIIEVCLLLLTVTPSSAFAVNGSGNCQPAPNAPQRLRFCRMTLGQHEDLGTPRTKQLADVRLF